MVSSKNLEITSSSEELIREKRKEKKKKKKTNKNAFHTLGKSVHRSGLMLTDFNGMSIRSGLLELCTLYVYMYFFFFFFAFVVSSITIQYKYLVRSSLA